MRETPTPKPIHSVSDFDRHYLKVGTKRVLLKVLCSRKVLQIKTHSIDDGPILDEGATYPLTGGEFAARRNPGYGTTVVTLPYLLWRKTMRYSVHIDAKNELLSA
jgi:hypothetical protein